MQAEGNRGGEMVARGQKALCHVLAGDMEAATQEIARAGELAEAEGELESLALIHLAHGKALVKQRGRKKAARGAFHRAAELFHTLGDGPGEARVCQELVKLDLAGGDFAGAVERIDRALGVLGPGDAPEPAIALYRLRADCHSIRGDLDATMADLDAALNLAQQSGSATLALQVRVERHSLQRLRSNGTSPEQLADLLRQARQIGDSQIADDVRLQQAVEFFQAGQCRQAFEQALAVRQAARDAADPKRHVRYLMASLHMADAQEGLGDRAEVLAALLTCKVYLEGHLGPAVGRQMNELLDTLKQRWGQNGLAQAVRIYRQRVQEQGPYHV